MVRSWVLQNPGLNLITYRSRDTHVVLVAAVANRNPMTSRKEAVSEVEPEAAEGPRPMPKKDAARSC